MELLTAQKIREIEQAEIDSGSLTAQQLMERSGRCVVSAVMAEWPTFANGAHRAVVLCGPGNNGGDGFVVARLLAGLGWSVRCYLFGDAEKLPPDARLNYERWREIGDVEPFTAYEDKENWGCDLLVDALFGIGLRSDLKALGGLFRSMEVMVDRHEIELGHQQGRPAIVAIDIPSGICSDSGRAFPFESVDDCFAASAHLTVTFHAPKIGHYLADGPARCGKLHVADIGLKSTSKQHGRIKLCETVHPSWLKKDVEHHKYHHGHALVLSGGPGRTGAARLAAKGALRIGAGLVSIGAPARAYQEVAGHITSLMVCEITDSVALERTLKDRRINAVCAGPGLGLGDHAKELLETLLEWKGMAVLDADALTLIASEQRLMSKLHEKCILTPHGGEFARLFPGIAKRLDEPAALSPVFSKVEATQLAAEQAGCIVVFKGADTVIASNNKRRCSVHAAAYDRAAPWLATAGSGDVLAGLITGLLARGDFPMMAAETATWLHTEAALSFGPGLISEDLPDELPKVLSSLLV